jgi:hypothetical protein
LSQHTHLSITKLWSKIRRKKREKTEVYKHQPTWKVTRLFGTPLILLFLSSSTRTPLRSTISLLYLDFYTMDPPHVLITGGCGFLGTSIISALLATKQYTVTALDITLPSLGSTAFSTNPAVRYVRCDVLDPTSLADVFSKARPTAVIHTAAVFYVGTKRYSMQDRDAVFKVNVEGTRNVLDVSREYGVKAFVYTSSIAAVMDELDQDFRNVDERWPIGRAQTSYGQSKVNKHFFFSNHPYFYLTWDKTINVLVEFSGL